MLLRNIVHKSNAFRPLVGFGLWKLDGAVAADVVYEAIKTGYRMFDGAASMYQ